MYLKIVNYHSITWYSLFAKKLKTYKSDIKESGIRLFFCPRGLSYAPFATFGGMKTTEQSMYICVCISVSMCMYMCMCMCVFLYYIVLYVCVYMYICTIWNLYGTFPIPGITLGICMYVCMYVCMCQIETDKYR